VPSISAGEACTAGGRPRCRPGTSRTRSADNRLVPSRVLTSSVRAGPG
jgi:hypothetical protein